MMNSSNTLVPETNVPQEQDVSAISATNTNSPIDVHVDVKQRVGATTAQMDRIWVDLVRKEIKTFLDIIDSAEHRIESDNNVVEGLMKLVLQKMNDKSNWMEQLEQYFTQDHFGEQVDTFYKEFALIQDKERHVIPSDFQDNHPMHMYSKALMKHQNHAELMNMKMDFHHENPDRTNHVNITRTGNSLLRSVTLHTTN
ncbi:hypothetical protein Tco_0845842 [Tanacetum coccineum]